MIEHFADGHEDVVGPFVGSGSDDGGAFLTYWKDGFFVSRHTGKGTSAGPLFDQFLFTTSDCSGPAYVDSMPVPPRYVFRTWKASAVADTGAYIADGNAVFATVVAKGPFNGGTQFCSPTGPSDAYLWKVQDAPYLPYWPYSYGREDGWSSLRVEKR